ncbi:iron-containing alcohol dehydrogenase [Desulfogranum japonicum]|uniref:iron-containing alcohol dehydrogenase n=1 Tax=Desulfogranum japonicum TaxID=231447 RepID=UPI0004142996|nr:iron-containing alcohol dehydrogenase [Desulfogranum japonicum]
MIQPVEPPKAFTFSTAGKIIFGPGTHLQLGDTALQFGAKVFLVHGKSMERHQPLIDMLRSKGLHIHEYPVHIEPTINTVASGVTSCHQNECDLVIGIGGGSVLDTGKAVATLVNNPGDITDYLEIIGRGKPLLADPLPYIAVPTTAGTGAEVTANAVIGSPEHRLKVSLRSPRMLPRVALVDPELTITMPPAITVLTGMDALTQVLEPYVSLQNSPLTDQLCIDGLKRAFSALPRACTNGSDIQARSNMALASLYGGLALANAKLGAVHGIAGPFGGMYDAPHGGICAALLPHVMAINIEAMLEREPENSALARYQHIAAMITGNPDADIHEGPKQLLAFCKQFSIPGLAAYGFSMDNVTALLQAAQNASSMKGNPIALTENDLRHILQRAL